MSDLRAPPSSVLSVHQRNQLNRRWIIAGVVCGAFLAALDTTILATTMPTIVGDLGGMSLYSWVFSVYMIMTAVSTPLWGKVSDSIGKRPGFFASAGIFLLGSVLCSFSANMFQLIIFRGIQGLAAGGLASIPFALVSTVFPVHERGKALGLVSSVWGVSSVIGPMIGSFMVLQLDWRWVFYVNIPVGVAAMSIIAVYYHEEGVHQKESIDYQGAALLCGGIMSLLLASLWPGMGEGIFSGKVLGSICVSVLCTILFIARERTARSPILELRFFARRAFWAGNLLGFLVSFSMYGVIAYTPLFANNLPNGSAVQTGIVVTVMSLSWSLASVVAGKIVYRVGERALITSGMLLMGAGFVLIMFTSELSSVYFLCLCVFVIGSGMGTVTPALLLSVQHSLETKNIGVATSTQMLARTIGGAIGVSATGAAVTASMLKQFLELGRQGVSGALPDEVKRLLGQPQELLGAHIRSLLSEREFTLIATALVNAFHDGLRLGLFITVIGLLVSVLLPPGVLHTFSRTEERDYEPD